MATSTSSVCDNFGCRVGLFWAVVCTKNVAAAGSASWRCPRSCPATTSRAGLRPTPTSFRGRGLASAALSLTCAFRPAPKGNIGLASSDTVSSIFLCLLRRAATRIGALSSACCAYSKANSRASCLLRLSSRVPLSP